MEIVTGLPAIGVALGASAHAALGNVEAADRAPTPINVQCDDLDLLSLYGMLELQDRLEQAIADVRWGSTGASSTAKAVAAAGMSKCPTNAVSV